MQLLTELALSKPLRHLVVTADYFFKALEATVHRFYPGHPQLPYRWLTLAQRFA
jgi:hypothetical protein